MKQRTTNRNYGFARVAAAGLAAATLAFVSTPEDASAQGLTYNKGQTVSPAYEGWKENPDGSYSMIFGYMNRNWEEEPDVPVGPNNYFEPGPADRGQPTHFLPRRNRFVFEVRVPSTWTEEDELVWTLVTQGEEKKAYGTLRADYFVDNVVIMSETGTLGAGTSDPELRAHTAPEVDLEVDTEIDAVVGQPVRLVARVTDDGLPERDDNDLPLDSLGNLNLEAALRTPSRITVNKTIGLHMTWFVYRGPEDLGSDDVQDVVTFNPPQVHPWEDTRPYSNSPWASFWVPPELPEDDRWVTEVTFNAPGTYVLKGRADDGGLFTDREVTVNVRGPAL